LLLVFGLKPNLISLLSRPFHAMEDIIKLIEIAKKKGQRSIQLVNQNFRKKEISKDNLLYEGIINGKFTTDEEASKAMFKADPGNRNYRNAKGKLRQKLLNHLYFLDYEKEIYTLYNRSEYECLHNLHQCKILIMEESHDIAIKNLPGLVKTAIEFEFIDVVVEALTLLRNEYALIGKTTPFQETAKELQYYKKFQEALHESEELYFGALVFINKSISAQSKILPKVPGIIDKIEDKAKKFKSDHLEILANDLRLLYNQLTWNFEENIKLCAKIEKKYLSKSNNDVKVNLDKKKIAFTRLYSYFCLADAKNGSEYAEKNIKQFKNGSAEWFNFIEYYFLLMMKGENFAKAGEIFRKVRTNKNFNLLEPADRDRWQIYRAYLIFVNDTKLIRWGFDLDEFLKEIPAYSKDYQGYNIGALTVQFMFLLREGNVDEVRKRVDEIQKYCSTHLDKRHNYRNSIFIRMLSIVTEKEFNYELIQEKGNTYYKKLLRTRIPSDIKDDMEVIHYEVLWNYILNILKTNKLYVHYRFYNIKTA
jgi:hypothetical protein